MRNDFESNYLMHHGVPGQKWGVRNGPPYPIEDKTLKKGYRLKSVSANSISESYKKSSGWLYTYGKDNMWDNMVYKGPFAYFKMQYVYKGQYQMFEHEFETLKDLKMPTSKERVDEFSALYKSKQKEFAKELQQIQDLMKQQNVGSENAKKVNLKKANTDEELKDAYEVFNHAMEFKNRFKLTQEYSRLMAEKYDAMVDDNNRGIYNDAQDPIIIFKPDEVLKVVGSARALPVQEIYDNLDKLEAEMNKKGKRVKL